MAFAIASLLAGLGLFFVGLYFLTEHLKMLSGGGSGTASPPGPEPVHGGPVGVCVIAITQSTAATMFILIGMMRSGMMTVRQSLPIIIGLNVGTGIVVLILVIDLKVAVLFLLGIAGIVYTNDRARAFRTVAGVRTAEQ